MRIFNIIMGVKDGLLKSHFVHFMSILGGRNTNNGCSETTRKAVKSVSCMSNQPIIIFAFFLSILSGCSLLTSPNSFLKEDFKKYHIKRVAVLPFCNNTSVKSAGEIVTRAFTEALFRRKEFEVELAGNVTKLLIEERIIIRKGIKSARIKLIGKRLNVDGVIIGRVEEYSGDKDGRTAKTVSVDARMVHTKSCSIVWTGQNKRSEDDYVVILDHGQISSTATLARKMVYELIETIP